MRRTSFAMSYGPALSPGSEKHIVMLPNVNDTGHRTSTIHPNDPSLVDMVRGEELNREILVPFVERASEIEALRRRNKGLFGMLENAVGSPGKLDAVLLTTRDEMGDRVWLRTLERVIRPAGDAYWAKFCDCIGYDVSRGLSGTSTPVGRGD